MLGMLGFYTPFVFMPSMAVSKAINIKHYLKIITFFFEGVGGVSVNDANFLISLIGVTNTLCRVLAGWLSDFDFVNALVLTNVAIAASGLTVAALPWCGDSYAAYVCLALVFGGTVAAYISLTSIVLVDLLGLDNLTSAFGLLVLFR